MKNLIFIIFLSLFSCKKKDTPEEVFKKFMIEVNAGNFEEAEKYCYACDDNLDYLKSPNYEFSYLNIHIDKFEYDESKTICRVTLINNKQDTFYNFISIRETKEWKVDMSKMSSLYDDEHYHYK